jgi:helicase MOV-10
MSTGSCNTPSCQFRHDAHTCEPCGIICDSTAVFNAHLRGKRHHKKVTDASTLFHCPICEVNVPSQKGWLKHVSGKRHRTEADRRSASTNVQPVEADSAPGQVFCSICNKLIRERLWARHPQSGAHMNKVRFMEYKAVLEEAEKDKHGVILTGDWDLGIVDVPSAQRGLVTRPIIKTGIPSSRITVVGLKFASSVYVRP